MLRTDALTCWNEPVVRDRLSWYHLVSTRQRPAKFLICRSILTDLPLKEASEKDVWAEHERLGGEFRALFDQVSKGRQIDTAHLPTHNFVDVKNELLHRMLRCCTFCEWRCRVDRAGGSTKGACHIDATSRVAALFHHFGEEAPLVGACGSGTVFFAGCSFRCVFCQNWDISQYPLNGARVDGRRLAAMMKTLGDEGAANINLVGGEPTPNLHTIVDGMRSLRTNVPMLWNSNMYLTPEAMSILEDLIDIWLPDFKYGNDRCALRLSKTMRYMEVTTRNHKRASEKGDMIVRHLVLPNHFECCTRPVLEWVAENCPRALVNVMGQYHPDYKVRDEAERYSDISRGLGWHEIRRAQEYAEKLGIVWRPVS